MTVLVLADVLNGKFIKDTVSKTVGAVSALGDVHILIIGEPDDGSVAAAASIASVSKVFCAEGPDMSHGLAEPVSDLIVSLAPNYTHIVGATNSAVRNILPRVAGLLDVMIVPDVIAILDADTFERPIYAGNAIQTVRSNDPVKVLIVRASAFDAVLSGGSAQVEKIALPVTSGKSEWIRDQVAELDRPDLTSAKTVVSGGRGVGSRESFALIEALADKLSAAVGASRAAVDSGFAPNDWQVGQTGKVVAPDLYIACGISGAIQHLAGMKDAKIIVAINKDEDAPIFQIADYCLVADLFAAVPELTQKLEIQDAL